MSDGAPRRRLPGWISTTGWVLLGTSAVGLPIALVVAALDVVRREGSDLERGVVTAALVLGAVVLVVALERGLAYAVREQDWSLGAVAGTVAGVAALVLLGALVPVAGLVLTAMAVVVALPASVAGLGLLAWWRWRNGPTPPARVRPSQDDVRARAEERRAAVRARNATTRAAVEQGLIGPGFTRNG